MKIGDIRLFENYDGGDFILKGNDVEFVGGFQNMPYLGMFGGNIESNTQGAKVTEQTFDFWGNFMLNPTNQNVWFNSDTERTLNTISLSSSTRLLIEQQVKKDLKFMEQFSTVNISVSIIGVDRIRIYIQIIEPNTNQVTEFSYIWDVTQNELITQPVENQQGSGVGLDAGLEYEL
jgi:hypothetical protein